MEKRSSEEQRTKQKPKTGTSGQDNGSRPYVILAAGPGEARNKTFADELVARLGRMQTAASLPLPGDFLEAGDARLDDLISSTGTHYVILHGTGACRSPHLARRADFRIYIEASDLDLTADKVRRLRQSPAAPKLSDEIRRIVRSGEDLDADLCSKEKQNAQTVIAADEQPDEASVGLIRYIQRTDPLLASRRVSEEERRNRINQLIRQFEGSLLTSRKAAIKRKLWLFLIGTTLFLKRLIDLLAAALALLLLSPLFAATALLIKLTDGGPVFYVQTRIGRHGKPFPFPKFRSMVLNADKLKDDLLKQAERVGDITFKMKRDPRVTRIGRFIRRFSIDELPQLWCVLKGDMSLVGPRPPVPREVALYTQEDRRRLEVTPGLTGIWQVSGRADIEFSQQVELDVLYIESHGFWLDILLLLKTIPAVFSGRGAY